MKINKILGVTWFFTAWILNEVFPDDPALLKQMATDHPKVMVLYLMLVIIIQFVVPYRIYHDPR